MIKQISLALSILGLSISTAYAGHVEEMLPVAPPVVNVNIPQQVGSWIFGGELIYWEAANGDFHYGSSSKNTVAAATTAFTDVSRKTHVVNPESDLGLRVNIGYNFEGSGRYVNLEWTHLDAGESSVHERDRNELLAGPAVVNVFIVPVSGLDVLVPYLPYGLLGNTNGTRGWDDMRGSSSNDFDSLDLVFGQRFDVGQKITLSAFGGLRYVDIENHETFNATVVDPTIVTPNARGSQIGRAHFESEYWGVGPRVGMNAQVRLGSDFSIVGTFAGSLLFGESDQKINILTKFFVLQSTVRALLASTELHIQDQTRVVPELDARIGVNYSSSFNSSSAFGLEVGYHVENYFGVKDNSSDSYFDSMSHNNDFALHGPYVRVQFEVA